jgi:hypothetical protein
MDKRDFLLKELDEKIEFFKKCSNRHKNFFRLFRYWVFALTAISALLAGLALKYNEFGINIDIYILVCSVVIGFLTSVEGLRKPAELWIHEKTTGNALQDLSREIKFMVDDRTDDKTLEQYFFRMQAILGTSGEKWNQQIVNAKERVLNEQRAGENEKLVTKNEL